MLILSSRDAATFSIVDGRENPYMNRNSAAATMGSEKYKLKWSKYESNVLNAFRDLFETEALSDVTLFCEGKQLATFLALPHN